MTDETGVVTQLLRAWAGGDLGARDELLPLIYEELRRQAAGYLRKERGGHTLQPTALVHEAYLRLIGQERVSWQNRAHFLGVASQMMRRILVDHARAKHAAKRPKAELKVVLQADQPSAPEPAWEVLSLHRALEDLAKIDSRLGQIVELRYFGGLAEREVAEALNVSRSTVTREWQTARAWLYRRITTGKSEDHRE